MPQVQSGTNTSLSEINMVPFIDVVLVLLIIFMVTAPLVQSGIDVTLPTTKTVTALTQVRMVVTIDRSQKVYLDDKPVNIHQLGPMVASKSRDVKTQSVYLRCDTNVPFGTLAVVLDALHQAGIVNANLVTRPLDERAQ